MPHTASCPVGRGAVQRSARSVAAIDLRGDQERDRRALAAAPQQILQVFRSRGAEDVPEGEVTLAHGIRLPILRLLQYYWIGSFFSNFLPSNVGGHIVRLSLMYRQGSLAVIGASILVERLVGLFVLLFLSAIGLLVLSRHFTESDVLLPMCLLILGMSSGLRVDVALIAPLIALVSFVPISINALGLAESAFVLFFTQAGLSAEQALAAAVLRRVLMTGYSLLGGLFWLRERPRLRPAQ